MESKFCTLAPNISGASVWNLLPVSLLEPRILENFCTPEFGPTVIKLKPSLCLIKQRCMTKYVGVEVQFHTFITAVLVGGELYVQPS